MKSVNAGGRQVPAPGPGEGFERVVEAYDAGRCVSAGLVRLVGAAISLARRSVVRWSRAGG